MDPLIFIDTNILLDFYRIGDAGLQLLQRILDHKDKVITSSQVEMEYKKNRQAAILASLPNLKDACPKGLALPSFLRDTKHAKALPNRLSAVDDCVKRLWGRAEKVLRNPSRNDPVYKSLEKLFQNDSKWNLKEDNPLRPKLIRLACRRFMLGQPPRKDRDTSIGDAVNWEWLIHCAQKSGKDIVIVSRDSDYGVRYGKEVMLNDWLVMEFKERVSHKRKLLLFGYLSDAFRQTDIQVTKKEEAEEKTLETCDLVPPLSAADWGAVRQALHAYQAETLTPHDREVIQKFREQQAALWSGRIAWETPSEQPPAEGTKGG